jgi:phenylacetate-CoA ligase
MTRIVSKFIYLFGTFFVNKKIFSHLKELQKSEYWSDSKLDSLQNYRLKKLLKHAFETTEYYKEKYKEFDLEEINIKNLNKLPLLSKESLLQNHNKMYSSNYMKSELILSETSGSTGDAFVFYRDKEWDAAHRAAIWRGIKQHDVEPYDKNIYLWGFIYKPLLKYKIRILDFFQNRFRIFNFTNEGFINTLKKAKGVRFISGYSSVINKLAEISIEKGIVFEDIKMIKGTSEKIYSNYQDNSQKAFGLPIISEYGAAETGIISYTCPEGKDHVIRENIIIEVVNGRAVITNLHSFSMPIIRFELGDYIELSDENCKCGRHSQVVADILGRVGVDIFGKKFQYPSLTLYYIFKELALVHDIKLSYSGQQHIKGKLKLIIFEEISRDIKTLIIEISKNYMPDMEIDVIVDMLKNRTNKLKDFESFV